MLRRRPIAPLCAVVVAAVSLSGCGDDDGDDPGADTAATTDPLPPDVGPVIATAPSADPEYLQRVLADGDVTAAELEAAYETYVQCLADGGAFGQYAYDVSLGAVLAVEWQVNGDDGLGSRAASLDAGCSHDYLGDLVDRFEQSHPSPDDLPSRQRASIVECVEAISPRAARAIPQAITTDTGADGIYIGEAQLDGLAFDPELAESNDAEGQAAAVAIGRCFTSLGATWHEFGDPEATLPPPGSTRTSTP